MTSADLELTLVVYALYAIDCVHWLAPGQTALTRRFNDTWKSRPYQEASFTLLGRMPVTVNPLDVRPGWILLKSEPDEAAAPVPQPINEFLEEAMPDRKTLIAIAAMAGFNLLIFLPALALSGLLAAFWQIPVGLLIATQTILAVELYAQARRWRLKDREGFWREFIPLILNPVAAIRCCDVLCQGLYTQTESKS